MRYFIGVFCLFLSSFVYGYDDLNVIDNIVVIYQGTTTVNVDNITNIVNASTQGITITKDDLDFAKDIQSRIRNGEAQLAQTGAANDEMVNLKANFNKKEYLWQNVLRPLIQERDDCTFVINNSTMAAAVNFATTRRNEITAKLGGIQQKLIDATQ